MAQLYNVQVRVGRFHRAYNFRPTQGWLLCDYTFGFICDNCGQRLHETMSSNDSLAVGQPIYELLVVCDCEQDALMEIVRNFDPPGSINEAEAGVAVTVMQFRLNGNFRMESLVGLTEIKWRCQVERKNEPTALVVRKFNLENGGFQENSRWDESDSDNEEEDTSSSGWNSDDPDRPCIENVTVTVRAA